MGRIFSPGTGDITQMVFPGDTVINVGPNRAFKTIGAALASLNNGYYLGSITIQLDDGTYNETTLNFNNPNYSGKININGDLAKPSACVINFTDQYGQGFRASNNNRININGGMTINGMFNPTTDQYTQSIFTATDNSTIIINNASSIVVNNAIYCFNSTSNGRIIVNTNGPGNPFIANNVFYGAIVDYQSVLQGGYLVLNASSTQTITCNNAQKAGAFHLPTNNLPVTGTSLGILTGQNCFTGCPFITLNGFHDGVLGLLHSHTYVVESTFNNIPGYALQAYNISYIASDQSGFTNCGTIAACAENSTIEINNPTAITGCTNIASASDLGYISAYGTSSFSVSGTKYNPPTSGTAGNAGAIINYS